MARLLRSIVVALAIGAVAAPTPAVLAEDDPSDSALEFTHVTKPPLSDGPYHFASEVENVGSTDVELPPIVVRFLDANGGVAKERTLDWDRVLAPGDRFAFDAATLADDRAVDVQLEFSEPPTPFGESKVPLPLELTDAFFAERMPSVLTHILLSEESFVSENLELDAFAQVRNTSDRPLLLDDDVKVVWYDDNGRVVDIVDEGLHDLRDKALLPGASVTIGPAYYSQNGAIGDERPTSFAMEFTAIDSAGEWIRFASDRMEVAKVGLGPISLIEDGLGKTYASTYVENTGDRDAVLNGAWARMRDGSLLIMDLPSRASRGMVQTGRIAVLPPGERIPVRFTYSESFIGEGPGAPLTEIFTVANPAFVEYANEQQVRQSISFRAPDLANTTAVEMTASSGPVQVVNEHHHGDFMVSAHMTFDSAQGPWVGDWSIERLTPFAEIPDAERERARWQTHWMPSFLENWSIADEYLQLLCKRSGSNSFSHCQPWQLLDAGEVISHECTRDGDIILNITPSEAGLRAPGFEVSAEGDAITLTAERLASDPDVEFNVPYRVAYELVEGPMLAHEFVIDCLYYEALGPELIPAPAGYFEAYDAFFEREEAVEELNRQAAAAADEATLDDLIAQAAQLRAENLDQLAAALGALSFRPELQPLVDEVIEASRIAADAARTLNATTDASQIDAAIDYVNEAQSWFQFTLDELHDVAAEAD